MAVIPTKEVSWFLTEKLSGRDVSFVDMTALLFLFCFLIFIKLNGCHTDKGGILVLNGKAVGKRCLLRRHDSWGGPQSFC